MTGREICEHYMRFRGVPEEDVEAAAREFWELSRSGELGHVFAARDEMERAGFL